MHPKAIILLVRMCCYFVYHCFVDRDIELAKSTLNSMYDLAMDYDERYAKSGSDKSK